MMRLFPLVLVLFMAAGVSIEGSPNPHPPPVDPMKYSKESLSSAASKHFDQWDRDRRGVLKPDDVSRLVHDHSVTDTSAAAIAALHLYQINHKDKAVTINKTLVDQLASKGGKGAGLPNDVHQDYITGLNYIRTTPRELFAEKAPSLQGLWQGRLGDCFVVSTVGAAVERNPEAVKKLFHPKADGSVELTFPGGHNVTVPKLTDAELAMGSTASAQGRWMPVLEKGIAMVLGQQFKDKPKVVEDNINGGDAEKAIAVMTGHKADYFKIRQKNPITDKEAAALYPKVHSFLEAATQKRHLLIGGTGGCKQPPGMCDHHDFAIMSFDGKKNEVQLWNPWSNDFEPKGAPGLEHGYPTKGGKFAVPLKDFLHIFDGISYETDQPAPKKS